MARKLTAAFENDLEFVEQYREATHMSHKLFVRSIAGVDVSEDGKVSFSPDCRLVKNHFRAWGAMEQPTDLRLFCRS